MTAPGPGFGEIAPMIALLALLLDMILGGLRPWAVFFGYPGRFVRGAIFRLAAKLNRARRGALIMAFAALIALLAGFSADALVGLDARAWPVELAFLLFSVHARPSVEALRHAGRGETLVAAEMLRLPVSGAVPARGDLLRGAWEGFIDRAIGPVFWFVIFGLPGLFLFTALVAAKDAIAKSDPSGAVFGMVAARLSGIFALFPTIIAWPLCSFAFFFVPGSHPAASFAAGARAMGTLAAPNAARGASMFLAALGDGKSPYKQGAWLLAVQLLLFAVVLVVTAYLMAQG